MVRRWAFFIMLPMYRAGIYTNAEYLEARFGVLVRVICAFVQVQYRTLVLGLIATAAFLTLSIISGWYDSAAWGLVGGIAVLAAIYTAFCGISKRLTSRRRAPSSAYTSLRGTPR